MTASRPPTPATAGPRRLRRRVVAVLGVLLLASLSLMAGLARWRQEPAPLDPALVVIAPFDAADPALQTWREGLMDALARNLDATGPMHIVSPTIVSRRWTGHADRQTVTQLALSLQAGTAVYGGLMRSGSDSVLASVTVLDVRTARPLVEIRQRDALARMDRLTDSISHAIVRVLAPRLR